MKRLAYLIGPFIGEFAWEYFHFAPYIINLIKKDPKKTYIIFTRSSRFDLYGKYADILVPLRIANDKPEMSDKFKMRGLGTNEYSILLRNFKNKYKHRYKILDTIYPEIRGFLYKVKWQYPRDEMNYDFQPRAENEVIVDKFIKRCDVLIDNLSDSFQVQGVYIEDYDAVYTKDLFHQLTDYINNRTSSYLGCFISLLKTCDFVIGNLSSDYSRLALLLKKPLIALNEKLSDDEIHLINPFNTPVIRCNNVQEGIDVYENHFRLTKCGVGQ